MIFAHGLEFKLDKICLTFQWNDEQKVREFFHEEGSSKESLRLPGFKYFDTMFEGMKVRCMYYSDFSGSDTDEVLFQNTDLVEVEDEIIRVQSLEFYYENAEKDSAYYKMVEDWLKTEKIY